MAMPKSVVRLNKGGVKIIDSVDKAEYAIYELGKRALGDSTKLVRKRLIEELKTLPGMKNSRRLNKAVRWEVPHWDTGAKWNAGHVGFVHDTWYGARSELGTHGSPARGLLRKVTYENIDEIRRIQGQYLSAINDENKAKSLIEEGALENKEHE